MATKIAIKSAHAHHHERGHEHASSHHAHKRQIHAKVPGKLVIVGFGSIGQGVLPLILRHLDIDHKDITIVTGDDRGQAIAEKEGVNFHVAEYDTQVTDEPKKPGRFENTWSVYGFHSEGVTQPSELGWGTHEKHWPADAKKHFDWRDSPIYMEWPGAFTFVRTWTPSQKHFIGRLVTHNESISLSEYFTYKENDVLLYRPTVHYAYRPCDAAVLSLEEAFGKDRILQDEQKILLDEIVSGMDELGVLLMGHEKNAYWYGSQLTIEETRKLAPYQNATGLQVTAGVLGAIVWAIENPSAGLVEAEDMDHDRVMEILEPYMGRMYGEYTDWNPLKGRDGLFPEDIDTSDPWQFKNFRYT